MGPVFIAVLVVLFSALLAVLWKVKARPASVPAIAQKKPLRTPKKPAVPPPASLRKRPKVAQPAQVAGAQEAAVLDFRVCSKCGEVIESGTEECVRCGGVELVQLARGSLTASALALVSSLRDESKLKRASKRSKKHRPSKRLQSAVAALGRAAPAPPRAVSGVQKNVTDTTSTPTVEYTSPPVGQKGCLIGKCFLITGVLQVMERDACAHYIRSLGGRVTHTVIRPLTHAVVGADGGASSKMRQISGRRPDVVLLSEQRLFHLVASLPAHTPCKPASPPPSSLGNRGASSPGETPPSAAAEAVRRPKSPRIQAVASRSIAPPPLPSRPAPKKPAGPIPARFKSPRRQQRNCTDDDAAAAEAVFTALVSGIEEAGKRQLEAELAEQLEAARLLQWVQCASCETVSRLSGRFCADCGASLAGAKSLRQGDLIPAAGLLYKKSAQLGHPWSLFHFASCCLFGTYGHPKDLELAEAMYRASAPRSALSAWDLGFCYETGAHFHRIDYFQAAYYYEMAERQGFVSRRNNLSLLRQSGADLSPLGQWTPQVHRFCSGPIKRQIFGGLVIARMFGVPKYVSHIIAAYICTAS